MHNYVLQVISIYLAVHRNKVSQKKDPMDEILCETNSNFYLALVRSNGMDTRSLVFILIKCLTASIVFN